MLHCAGGTTEDLSARLAQSCPAYFKEDDMIFYEASGLLQRAEAATAAAEKDHLTRSALKLMMKVCPLSLSSGGCCMSRNPWQLSTSSQECLFQKNTCL